MRTATLWGLEALAVDCEGDVGPGLPGFVLVGLGRTLLRVVTQFDRANFGLTPLQDGAASLLSTAGDAIQMVLFVAPLAPLAVGLFWLLRDRASREAAVFLLSVVTPMLAVLLLFRSPLGLIRNWTSVEIA